MTVSFLKSKHSFIPKNFLHTGLRAGPTCSLELHREQNSHRPSPWGWHPGGKVDEEAESGMGIMSAPPDLGLLVLCNEDADAGLPVGQEASGENS